MAQAEYGQAKDVASNAELVPWRVGWTLMIHDELTFMVNLWR